MKRHGPVNVIFYYPKSEASKEELARRVAEVHADAVIRRIKNLDCPTSQKLELLDAVIATAKENARRNEPTTAPQGHSLWNAFIGFNHLRTSYISKQHLST